MKGAQNFQASDVALAPLRMETWGHLIFLNFGASGMPCSQQLLVPRKGYDLIRAVIKC